MIPLNVVKGPHKGRVGQLLGYAVDNGKHYACVLLADTKPKLTAIRLDYLEVIMPEPAIPSGDEPIAKVVKL